MFLAYSCNAQEFRCGDGLCVKKQYLCDGVYQCNDRSDELHCNDNDVDSDNKIIGKTKCMLVFKLTKTSRKKIFNFNPHLIPC